MVPEVVREVDREVQDFGCQSPEDLLTARHPRVKRGIDPVLVLIACAHVDPVRLEFELQQAQQAESWQRQPAERKFYNPWDLK